MRSTACVAGIGTLVLALVACESEPIEQAPQGDIKMPMELTTTKKREAMSNDTLEQWLQRNTERFYGATVPDSALRIITQGIGARRIVLLGESEGAVAQHASLKMSIVRTLHERHGFNVLAFEGPMWQCTPELNPSLSYRSLDVQASCAIGDWNNSEIGELFRYIESTRRTRTPLVLIGLDAAKSGEAVSQTSLSPLVAGRDRAYARRVQSMDSAFAAFVAQGMDTPISQRKPVPFSLAMQLDSLSEWFARIASEPVADDADAARYAVAAATARTHSDVARLFGGFTAKVPTFADNVMAENLAFVADTLFPAQKVIVWSRNSRIVRWKPTRTYQDTSTSSMAAMYERASPANTPYSIALFGVNGDELREQRSRALPRPIDGSIEQLLYDSMGRTVLLTTNALGSTSRFDRPDTRTNRGRPMHWGLRSMERYDAVIVVSNVSAATPLPR